MALISNKSQTNKQKIKVQIDAVVLEDIQRYCEWAGVEMDFFLEEASRFVFAKDKEWKAHHRKPGRRGRKPASATEADSA